MNLPDKNYKKVNLQGSSLRFKFQELQDKVNSLGDSGDGSVHFPSLSVIVLSPRGMLSRDSGLQADARNLYGTSRHDCGKSTSTK